MNRPVLITGASGFLGAHLKQGLRNEFPLAAYGGHRGVPAAGVPPLFAAGRIALEENESVHELIKRLCPRAVIHCAALSTPSRCEKSPGLAEESNVQATKNLLDACQALSLPVPPVFLYISTDMVFDGGEAPRGGFLETSRPVPTSVYAKTKREAEIHVLNSPLPAAVLRTALIFGGKIERLEGFMSWMRAGFIAGSLELFSDEFRTPVWTEDIIRVISLILRGGPHLNEFLSASSLHSRILHLAGPEKLSRVEMGQAVAEVYGFHSQSIRSVKRPQSDSAIHRPSDISLSSERVCDLLGIRFHRFLEALNFVNEHSSE